VDWNVLNFERYKWAGVEHLELEYAAFDLERFSQLDSPVPSAEDLAVFRILLTTASTMPGTARIGDLEKALGSVLPSNRNERRVLLEILGYCGILAPPDHPGFAGAFVPWRSRDVRAGDWTYPVCWWRGFHGVNATALTMFFPMAGSEQ
jgi:hypothetical protein